MDDSGGEITERAGGVPEGINRGACALEHRDEQVTGRSFLVVDNMASGIDGAASPAGQDQGKVLFVVAVSIAAAAAVKNHTVVTEGAITLPHRLQPLDKLGELRDVETVDPANLLEVGLSALVMRKAVMAIGNRDLTVAPVAAGTREHQG